MPPPSDRPSALDPQRLLAAYFVLIWGSGYVASRIALQDASPFSFLTLRFALTTLVLIPVLVWLRPRWPATRVTSLLYLTPVVTLGVEWLFFSVLPDAISLAGAGAACLGVWLVTRRLTPPPGAAPQSVSAPRPVSAQ